MIKLKEILNPKKKLNEGGEKTYLSLIKLDKEIRNLEKTFKREKRGMTRDRASNVEKSIVMMRRAWTAMWADFQSQ